MERTMLFGADYYPEHWDKSEWKGQAKLMHEAHLNVVRVAEFAWGRLEPRENEFDFTWLDEAIDVLADEGVRVILGTPTATPPKWLMNQYDVYLKDRYGRKRDFGSRRQCCANSPDYQMKSRIIVEKMAEHYADNPNVVGWQIDNEFGCHGTTQCFCQHCKNKFSRWLEAKYGEINQLNKTYGTVFWSQEYADFEDVILPAYTACESPNGHNWSHNPSLDLDFFRFSSDSWVNYENMQIEILKKYSDKPVTHNFMGHFSDIDYYKLGEKLDVVSWDNYIDDQWGHNDFERTSMAHELMYGIKNQNFWVMEEQAGPCGWDRFGRNPDPGQIRLWVYQALAHGCDGLLFFRFKSATFGMEQYWLGLIDHDGKPRRRYFEVQKTGEELMRLQNLFLESKGKSDVLILKDYENDWSHRIKQHVDGFEYTSVMYSFFKANTHLGTNPQMGNWKRMKDFAVVYAPAYILVSEEIRSEMETYVKNGGHLVLSYRSGVKDIDNNMVTETLPGKLAALAGLTVEESDFNSGENQLTEGFGTTKIWRDIVETTTAETIATYQDHYYQGTPAITKNQFGKGVVWYVACDLDDTGMEKLVSMVTKTASAYAIPHPQDTEIICREANGKEYLMLLNYAKAAKEMGITGKSVLHNREFDGTLAGYEVEILDVSR